MVNERENIGLLNLSQKNHILICDGKFPEPWIESMSVPKAASKVAWTKYELDNNLNDGTPTPTEKAEVASANQAAVQFMAPPAAVGTAPTFDPFAPATQAVPTVPPAFQQG